MTIDYTRLKDMEEKPTMISDDLKQVLGTQDEPFTLSDHEPTLQLRNLINHGIALLSAIGQREPKAFKAKITSIFRDKDGEIFMLLLTGNGDYTYFMDINEAPDAFRLVDDTKLLGKEIVVIAYTYTLRNGTDKVDDTLPLVDQVNIFVSYKERLRYWEEKKNNLKIMKGKVNRVRPEGIEVASLGQRVTIPLDQYYGMARENFLKGRIIRFVITDVSTVNGVLKIKGSELIVHKFYKEVLHDFYQHGVSFKAEVVNVLNFGAYLYYKDTVMLILRNRDFSSDFSKVADVIVEGRKLDVKVLGYGNVSDDSIHVEMKEKYHVEKPIDYRDYNVGDILDDFVIRTISPFGAYAGSLNDGMRGRDVLIAIHEGQREPRIGDRVSVELKIINPQTGSAKGDIVKYHDDILDLSEFELE